MKPVIMKKFKKNEGLEDGLCPGCGEPLLFMFYINDNGQEIPEAVCDNCNFMVRQTDDYMI